MGTKYTTQSASGYNSSPPADDGTQVASNLVTWAGVKTKLADPIKTLADAENTALVAALDLSARAISSPDTAIASDHWKTLQVTGTTAVTLSSAASMGAGYEVGIFNAGVGVVTVTPGNAADTINGVSASVTVSIKGTKIFRTNQALTGYNVVGGYDPQTVTATTSVVTPLILTTSGPIEFSSASGVVGANSDNTTTSGSAAKRWAAVFVAPGGININVTKRKTADESVTSSTGLQDDDHLTFAIAANEEWVANYYLDVGPTITSSGIKVAITAPSGAALNIGATMTGTTIGHAGAFHTTTSGTALDGTTTFFSSDATGIVQLNVWCLNGATPGNMTLQFAQSTSSGTAITVRKGSFMQATRVA